MRGDTHSESGEYGLCDGMSNVERELELANL